MGKHKTSARFRRVGEKSRDRSRISDLDVKLLRVDDVHLTRPISAAWSEHCTPNKGVSVRANLQAARRARDAGASRFCMAAAWRNPKDKDLDQVCEMVSAVKDLGMETCATLGMLTEDQARRLQQAGLDFYNHNVDTSPEFYGQIITTRTMQDRIDTLGHVRNAGLKVCCGGIVGMGEKVGDRLGMLMLLANMAVHPESVPINMWNEVKGVPVNDTAERPDPIALVRMIAVARIMMPKSVVRLSAGRQYMTDELQALCFVAGANSIFIGDVLLTTKNPQTDRDANLLGRLGMTSKLDAAAPAEVQIAG